MRDRIEKFVLLPFTAGCVSESSIAVGLQQHKRSKLDTGSIPTRTHGQDEESEEDEESLSGENVKSPASLLALPRFQKLLKNFKNSFAYKDEIDQTEIRMEIGFPTDVKHVTHIGLDGCASSILSRRWDNLSEPEITDLPSFALTPLELAMAARADKPTMRSLLETK